MALRPAAEAMQSLLYNDPTIQGLLTSWVYSATTYYAVFNSALIPDNVLTDAGNQSLTVENTTINHFQVDNEGGGHPVIDLTRQVSCRAYTQAKAEDIQAAAFNALNRVKSSTSPKVQFIADKLPVIVPTDKADNFNAPLNVRCITVRE